MARKTRSRQKKAAPTLARLTRHVQRIEETLAVADADEIETLSDDEREAASEALTRVIEHIDEALAALRRAGARVRAIKSSCESERGTPRRRRSQ